MHYFIYGHSLAGKSHLSRSIDCQDANKYRELEGGWVVAAVADGVGSASNAKKGAEIAVDVAVDFVAENMPLSFRENGIKRAIYLAFNAALKTIMIQADQEGYPLESYDTTLSLVVFNGVKLYYGHAGDGGIFGLTVYGEYIEITKPNVGKDGTSVIPLRFGEDTWIIDAFRENLTSVLLVTDGVRAAIRPYELGTSEKDVYVPICALLMHPAWFQHNKQSFRSTTEKYFKCKLDNFTIQEMLFQTYKEAIQDSENFGQAFESVITTDNTNSLIRKITDDITALGIVNSVEERKPDKKPASYYTEPNWSTKRAEINRELYSTTGKHQPPSGSSTYGAPRQTSASALTDKAKPDFNFTPIIPQGGAASYPNKKIAPQRKPGNKGCVILVVIVIVIMIIVVRACSTSQKPNTAKGTPILISPYTTSTSPKPSANTSTKPSTKPSAGSSTPPITPVQSSPTTYNVTPGLLSTSSTLLLSPEETH